MSAKKILVSGSGKCESLLLQIALLELELKLLLLEEHKGGVRASRECGEGWGGWRLRLAGWRRGLEKAGRRPSRCHPVGAG